MIGKRGNFEVKRFGVWGSVSEEEFKKIIEEKDERKRTLGERYNKHQLKSNLNIDQFDQLEEWTSLECSSILFDSNIDNWSWKTSVFNERIIGKKQLTFLIEYEDGEIFGYYLNTQVKKKYDEWQETDSNSFQFNLQSKNNRLKQPMKYKIKNLKEGGICLCKNLDDYLIWFGEIYIAKENNKNASYCLQNEDYFDYHEFDNAVCGKLHPNLFTPQRILVIQMQ